MTDTFTNREPYPSPPAHEAGTAARMEWYAAVARWAPSKHNSQPWRFVVRQSCLEFWADPMRILPETDPHRREMVISCGAAVHLACVAARGLGRQPEVTLLPQGPGPLLARLMEVGPWPTGEPDRALLDCVSRRRTDRGPLDDDPLPSSLPYLLQSAAADEGASLRLVTSTTDRDALALLVERSDRLLVRRAGVDREVAEWSREPGDARPDGVPTTHARGPAASYRAEFVQRDFSSPGTPPTHDRPGRDHPIVGVLCTPGDEPREWLVAGQAMMRVLLHARLFGANASFLNQPVEEPAIRELLQTELALPGVAQIVLRMGVGANVEPTPRRNADELTFHVNRPAREQR